MSKILDLITLIGALTVPNYAQQNYDKSAAEAEASFDANLKSEVIAKLKMNNIVFGSDAEFDAFAALRLTLVQITGTNTKMICLDVVLDINDEITSYGTALVQWQGAGYEVIMQNPLITVKTFA